MLSQGFFAFVALSLVLLEGANALGSASSKTLFESKKNPQIFARYNNGQMECWETSKYADKESEEVDCPPKSDFVASKFQPFGLHIIENAAFWPEGNLCYNIASGTYPADEEKILFDAIDTLTTKTNLRFTEINECSGNICGNCSNYINFKRSGFDGGCYSSVGMVGGGQTLMLNGKCFGDYNFTAEMRGEVVVMHEIMHAAGFYHEQQHEDRDVIIIWEEAMKIGLQNFKPMTSQDSVKTPYDIESIMHYGERGRFIPEGPNNPRFLCLPKPRCTDGSNDPVTSDSTCIPAELKLCNYDEDETQDNCKFANDDYCQPINRNIGAAVRISEGDIASINSAYPRPTAC